MNGNGLSNPFRGYLETMRPHAHNLGRVAAAFGCQTIDLLAEIARNTGSHVKTRRYVDPMNFAGGDTKTRDVGVGETQRMAMLAVSAATTVTIRSGGRLMYVKTFTAADTIGPDAQVTAGPGSSWDITSSGPAEITVHLRISRHDDAQYGHSGERPPSGIHTNAMDLALRQHFPDLFTDPPEDHIPHVAGSLRGASD